MGALTLAPTYPVCFVQDICQIGGQMISQSWKTKINATFQKFSHIGCLYMHNSHQQKKWADDAKGLVSDATLTYLTDECGC